MTKLLSEQEQEERIADIFRALGSQTMEFEDGISEMKSLIHSQKLASTASELQKLSTPENDTIWYTDTENDVVMTLEDRIAELLGDDKQSSLSVVHEADNYEQDGKR